jgi:hypothetical protein
MADQTRPAANAVSVTTSDSSALDEGVRALYVGGAGDVAVKFPGQSNAVTFVGVVAGSVLSIQAEYVMSTNTTATDILALY